jgi:hypothetical protein
MNPFVVDDCIKTRVVRRGIISVIVGKTFRGGQSLRGCRVIYELERQDQILSRLLINSDIEIYSTDGLQNV